MSKSKRATIPLSLLSGLLSVVGCGDSPNAETTRQDTIRPIVKGALPHLEYREGSTIRYFDRKMVAGDRLTPIRGEAQPVTLSTDGYLVFVDEQPTYDWDHDAQIVFCPAKGPGKPVVLFRRMSPGHLLIEDGKGNDVRAKGIWHDY